MKALNVCALFAAGASALYINPHGFNATKALRLDHLAANSSTCSPMLTPGFEFPHLLVPIDSAAPNTQMGTSFNGQVSSTVSSLFNFDIPEGGNLNMCSLVFHFPSTKAHPSDYYVFQGDGMVRFGMLQAPATISTTFANAPTVREDYGTHTLRPGNTYPIANFPCPKGQKIGIQMSNAGSTVMNYFQNYGTPT